MKYSYDYKNLQIKILENNMKLKDLANALNISKAALSKKINNQTGFTQDQILKTISILKIEPEEIHNIFFKEKVKVL